MQKTCLRLYYDRKTSGDIARVLRISKSTVETHLAQARRTLGVTRSVEAAVMLHEHEERGPSCKPPTYSTRLPETEPNEEQTADRAVAIPRGSQGVTRNDLSIRQRLFWIVAIAIGLALGAGAVANTIRLINDLARR